MIPPVEGAIAVESGSQHRHVARVSWQIDQIFGETTAIPPKIGQS
jgi:hypothetical protein